jgi:predicted nucleic acid-binding protein
MLLDTDVLVDLKRGHSAARTWLAMLPATPTVAGFAALELAYGSWDSKELVAVQRFLRVFPLLWPTEADNTRVLIEYPIRRLAQGIGLIDCLIAATAVGAGLPLATFNVKHFRHIPGLTLVQPYVR